MYITQTTLEFILDGLGIAWVHLKSSSRKVIIVDGGWEILLTNNISLKFIIDKIVEEWFNH